MIDANEKLDLIRRLEIVSRNDPAGYRRRVALVAALGYAYLLLVVLVLLTLVFVIPNAMWVANQLNAAIIKLVWIPLVLAGIVLRSMWVTIPAPDGKELKHEDAEPLFELITEVRRAVVGPKIHHVLLSDDYNAGIVQIPRFGMFGGSRNYLVVGLPLLMALGPEEFRAVIAHEFGHLSGKHGRFAGWIYRLRQSWVQILTRVHIERRYARFLFEWFLNWYAPYFNAYSFVLARAQEYEADSIAVELSGRTVAARALVQLQIKERLLIDEHWGNFYRQANDTKQAPKDPFSQMLTSLEQPIAEWKLEKWFSQALKVQTGYDDTHPALAERLSAIGFDRQSFEDGSVVNTLLPQSNRPTESAATRYLGLVPQEIADSYDRLWKEQVSGPWREVHGRSQELRKRAAELHDKAERETLTVDELWELARCLAETRQTTAASTLLTDIIRRDPDHVRANFALGAILVAEEDPAGLELLEKVMELDPTTVGDASEQIYDFLSEQGRKTEAKTYREKADKFYEEFARQQAEVNNLSASDNFVPHDLDDTELSDLQSQLAEFRGLKTAYLVRRFADEETTPLHVLGVLADYKWNGGESELDSSGLLNDLVLNLGFAKPALFVSVETDKRLEKRLAKVPRAQIFPT